MHIYLNLIIPLQICSRCYIPPKLSGILAWTYLFKNIEFHSCISFKRSMNRHWIFHISTERNKASGFGDIMPFYWKFPVAIMYNIFLTRHVSLWAIREPVRTFLDLTNIRYQKVHPVCFFFPLLSLFLHSQLTRMDCNVCLDYMHESFYRKTLGILFF